MTAMRYRIICSSEAGTDYLFSEDKRQAELIFDMAVESKLFCYVSLEEANDSYSMKKEWVEDDDQA